MQLDKKKINIYFVSAVIVGGLIFMGGTGYLISNTISAGSSAEMLIDKQVDECYEKLEEKKESDSANGLTSGPTQSKIVLTGNS